MTGNTLLKNIKKNLVYNGDKFIYRNQRSQFDKMYVYFEDGLLYFDLFSQRNSLTSKELLDGDFEKYPEKNRLYEQAIGRLLKSKSIVDRNDTYNAIASLE